MNVSISTLARPLALTAATAAMVTLAACSGPAPVSTPAPAASPAASQSAAASTPDPSESASSPAASPSATAAAEGNDALLAASALAAKEISKGTVVSIEAEPNGWEVHVVTADGDEQQLRTDLAGTKIISGPVDDRPDADDRTENKEFAGGDVDVKQAIAAIEKEIDGAQINELSLDFDNRRIVWEADVTTGSEQRSVQIDADNGDVVSNRIDD